MLVDKRRQDILPGIHEAYNDQANQYFKRVEVFAASAVELTDKECGLLSDKLARHLGSSVLLRTRVDPGLLGGLVCRIGDTVYDGSLRGRLNRLGRQILKG